MATMDFAAVLQALNQASGFELYRLRAAIDRVLADPKWIRAVQSQLRIGQEINFFDARANKLLTAEVLDFRKKEVLVRQLDTDERWLIAYTCINLDGADVRIREQTPHGLSPQSVAVGDTVGFLDRDQQQRSGKIIRLNEKTVTLLSNGQKWRVGYGLHGAKRVEHTHGHIHSATAIRSSVEVAAECDVFCHLGHRLIHIDLNIIYRGCRIYSAVGGEPALRAQAAGGVHKISFRIESHGTFARVAATGILAVYKETIAFHTEVKVAPGILKRTLGEIRGDETHAHTEANLGGVDAAEGGGRCRAGAQHLGELILE